MEALTSGTLAGTGSFRCDGCGYVVTLVANDELPRCAGCGGSSFGRASLFGGPRFERPAEQATQDLGIRFAEQRAAIEEPGEYLIFADLEGPKVVALGQEWTRIGRSLAADIRFDDPTVSRRHALLVRQADGVRVLDDRSLNGVFVNGNRVEWQTLADGDEILVGRYELRFAVVTEADVSISGMRTPDTAAGG